MERVNHHQALLRSKRPSILQGLLKILSKFEQFDALCNQASVALEPVEEAEVLRTLIERHRVLTGSARAAAMLADWPAALRHFVQVMPTDYRRALAALEAAA